MFYNRDITYIISLIDKNKWDSIPYAVKEAWKNEAIYWQGTPIEFKSYFEKYVK